jgi:hypothetical protein
MVKDKGMSYRSAIEVYQTRGFVTTVISLR